MKLKWRERLGKEPRQVARCGRFTVVVRRSRVVGGFVCQVHEMGSRNSAVAVYATLHGARKAAEAAIRRCQAGRRLPHRFRSVSAAGWKGLFGPRIAATNLGTVDPGTPITVTKLEPA